MSLIGCQNNTEIESYLAPDSNSYAVFFIVEEKSDTIVENELLSDLYIENFQYISQFGILKSSTEDAKIISEELLIDEYPAYILFNFEEALLIEQDYNKFKLSLVDIIARERSR